MQDAFGLDYPIQDHFDLGIGTSSGAVGLAALFIMYWDTKTCVRFWHKFATRVFEKIVLRSTIAKCWWYLASYFADGLYDAVLLEEALQEKFEFRRLFGPTESRPSGMKIAITATTISNATLCLFTNYNGSKCKHIRPYSASDEVLLWEALRCTTAAPWYYKTKFLEAFGTFQDAPNVRNLFQDGAIARLYRASMSSLSLDSGNSWKDHWHGLEKDIKGQHFRLDVPLKGRVPNIDEVDQMADLQDQVRNNLGDMDGLARAFRAVSFFFELNEPPIREGIIYVCRGSILSRSPDSRALVQNITSRYPYSRFITDDEVSLGSLSLDDICQGCGRFQKKVTISVRHPVDVVDLLLCCSRLFRRSISGFPNPMKWFEERQNLKATFGRADHGEAKALSDSDCSCVHRRRHADVADTLTPAKRRLTLIGTRRSKRRRL
ncbi:hypothetical protein VE03_06283 [Pseudogymnoascus sp. 23342-1-I1]|nr:hypothetical protein VE03_06283 [Pseudogymnoascus sp. 23342-1-I1]